MTDVPLVAVESPEPRTVKVVIAEDHDLLRYSLRGLLESTADIEVMADGRDLAVTRRHLAAHQPDVLVLDLDMPDGSSLELIRNLVEKSPQTHVVVVSGDDALVFAQRALAAGAIGYVLKDNADTDLVEAVAAAAHGLERVSASVARRLSDARRALTGGQLSVRETEVLRLIALGHTNQEIATQLGVSPRTVETHRAHVHRKLGMRTRAQLVGYALRRGLLAT
jgi:two-component system response regulator NreC